MRKILTSLVCLAVLTASQVYGFVYPECIDQKDCRLRQADYNPDEVYALHTTVGYASAIILRQGEELETWGSGDSGAWEVDNKKNMVTIKPIVMQSKSNLFLLSSAGRVYTFQISIDKTPYYMVRFNYPAEEAAEQAAKKEKDDISEALAQSLDPAFVDKNNIAYIAAGNDEIRPKRVFDNGSYTFMYFAEGQDLPAVFRSTPDGEKMTQKHTRGNYLIIPHVEREWMLRLGTLVCCVRNENVKDEVENFSSTSSPAVILKPNTILE